MASIAPPFHQRKLSSVPLRTNAEDSDTDSRLGDPSNDVAHVLSAERREALQQIDRAIYSPIHLRIVLVAGVGFLAEAYDIFAIGVASHMLGYLYGEIPKGELPGCNVTRKLSSNDDLSLKVATSAGTLVGHLLFGWAADVWGRKRMYGYELILITVATFTQALAGSAPGLNIIGVLIFWRFLMGVGVGGDYPLSALITSEFASTHIRGRLMAAVFACQGWGNLLASLVALVVVFAYKTPLQHNRNACEPTVIEPMWRLLIGLGCIPGVAAMYFRLTISETPRFTMDIEHNVQQASEDINQFLDLGTSYADPDAVIQARSKTSRYSIRGFLAYYSTWSNAKVLLGTSWSWLATDVAFYGLGLNSSTFDAYGLKSVPGTTPQTKIANDLAKICQGNLIIAAGLIPGYWASFFVIDKFGRKLIQYMGFAVLAVLFAILGLAYDKLIPKNERNSDEGHPAHPGFIVLYCLANFFQNFGPNVTTFILPGELFPTRYRSTSFGISAASGKFGAIISQIMFAKLVDRGGESAWVKNFFFIYAVFMLSGLASTYLIPETKGRSLEDLSNEKQDTIDMSSLPPSSPTYRVDQRLRQTRSIPQNYSTQTFDSRR